jgi:hypothetical protein
MSTSGWDDKTFLGLIRDRAFLHAETWMADDDVYDPENDERTHIGPWT